MADNNFEDNNLDFKKNSETVKLAAVQNPWQLPLDPSPSKEAEVRVEVGRRECTKKPENMKTRTYRKKNGKLWLCRLKENSKANLWRFVKKQEDAAELAGTQATLKVLEEMAWAKQKLEDLWIFLEVENTTKLALQEFENALEVKVQADWAFRGG